MVKKNVINLLISEANKALERFGREYTGLTWRQKVLQLVKLTRSIKKLGVNTNAEAAHVGARDRIRLYLTKHVGIVIDSRELEVVSGISEFARRVRELRVQEGFKVLTGVSNDPDSGVLLKPSQYLLVDPTPDITAARRWALANRIRRETKGGSRARLLKFFMESVGQVLNTEELAYVADAREFGRRVRELRTEEGYAIATQFTGRPDLKMGEYVLESKDRIAEPHDRRISMEVQKAVYERDKNTCRLCGWNRRRWRKEDPRILELHHLQMHKDKGPNLPKNLLTVCSLCHNEVHAGRQVIPPDITV